ncbi:MAG: hypothetical protein AAGE92_06700 [Cyanobacteria bacterium P01_G01_bin.4]
MAKPTDAAIGAMFLGEQPSGEQTAEPIEEAPAIEDNVIEQPEADSIIVETDEGEQLELESEQPAEPEASDLVEFELDGELYEAPRAVADAIMRTNVFTQKTQEVSAQRKQYEVGIGQVEETRRAYEFANQVQSDRIEIAQASTMIAQYEQHLADNVRNMTSQDMTELQLQIRNMERFRDQKEAEIAQKQQEFQQAQEQSIAELLNKSTEVLRSKIPTWNDSHESTLREYGQSQGFTEKEIGSVLDPRQKLMLWKASQYDKLQEGKAAAVKKAQNAPTIKAKSSNPMPQETRDKLNLRKTIQSNNLTPAQKQAAVAKDIGKRWAG